jgi:hypothetical protein
MYRHAIITNLLTHQSDLEDLHAIELASWNNIGHIQSHLSEHESAMQCRSHIYQTLKAIHSVYSMHRKIHYYLLKCSAGNNPIDLSIYNGYSLFSYNVPQH